MRMRISIIVPNYNHFQFLPKRLETIFNQTFPDFEVILLDDCSTDGSWEYLKQYEDHEKVSHCIRNESNSGSPFKQWKKGIDLGKGDIIWIAESDDYCENNFLDEMLVRLGSQSSLVYCNSHYIDSNNNLIYSKFPNWSKKDTNNILRWNSDYSNDGKKEISNFLSYRNTIVNASSVIFRKPSKFPSEILSMKYCGDWYFWIYILQFGDLNYCFKKLNYFRAHDSSSRAPKSKEIEYNRIKEISKCITFSRSINSINYPRYKDLINYSYLTKYYAWNFKKLNLSLKFLLYVPYFLTPVFFLNYSHHLVMKFYESKIISK